MSNGEEEVIANLITRRRRMRVTAREDANKPVKQASMH